MHVHAIMHGMQMHDDFYNKTETQSTVIRTINSHSLIQLLRPVCGCKTIFISARLLPSVLQIALKSQLLLTMNMIMRRIRVAFGVQHPMRTRSAIHQLPGTEDAVCIFAIIPVRL